MTKNLCLGQSELPVFAQPHAQAGFYSTGRISLRIQRGHLYAFSFFLSGTHQPLHTTYFVLVLGWTLGRQKDGELRKTGVPPKLLAYLGLAEASQQSLTMHQDKSPKKSHNPPLPQPGLIHLSPRLLPDKEVCRALP